VFFFYNFQLRIPKNKQFCSQKLFYGVKEAGPILRQSEATRFAFYLLKKTYLGKFHVSFLYDAHTRDTTFKSLLLDWIPGGVIPRQQKGVEVFKLTSSGRGFKQKAVTSAVVTSPFDVGVSETAYTMGKVQSTAATNQLRQKPAQNSNTDDSSYWDYDFGDFYEDDEDDWPEASSLPRRNTDDDDSNPKRQQYVFQPRRSLMK
jgi:hypothetical protein